MYAAIDRNGSSSVNLAFHGGVTRPGSGTCMESEELELFTLQEFGNGHPHFLQGRKRVATSQKKVFSIPSRAGDSRIACFFETELAMVPCDRVECM